MELLPGNEQSKYNNCLCKALPFFLGLGLLRAMISMAAEVSVHADPLLFIIYNTGEMGKIVGTPFLQG